MATCGDCKKNVGGKCKDTRSNGKPWDFEVTGRETACTDGGFVAKEKRLTCGDCARFKGPHEICGGTSGKVRVIKFKPHDATAPACTNDQFIPKVTVEKKCGTCISRVGSYCTSPSNIERNKADGSLDNRFDAFPMPEEGGSSCPCYSAKVEVRVKTVEEVELPSDCCGKCEKYKGPGEKCGSSFLLSIPSSYAPRGPQVGPCNNGYVKKKDPTEFSVKIHDFGKRGVAEGNPADQGRCLVMSDGVVVAKPSSLGETRRQIMDMSGSMGRPTLEQRREAENFVRRLGRGCLSREMQEDVGNINQTVTKGTSTMSNAIIRLADSNLNKEITDFGGLSLDLKDALAELQTEERKHASKAAAKEILDTINLADSRIESYVGNIQTLRRNIETSKSNIREVNKAKAYGLATNNFVPLGVLVGTVDQYSVYNKDLLKIDESKLPADWDKKPSEK
jgi:hypothetical protein